MKLKQKIALLLVCCQLLLVLGGCSSTPTTAEELDTAVDATTQEEGGTEDTQGEAPEGGTPAVTFDLEEITDSILTTAGVNSTDVVATAGEHEITAQEMLYFATSELDYYLSTMAMYGMGELPWGLETQGMLYEESVKKTGVELALLHRVMPKIANEEGIDADPASKATAQTYLDDLKADLGGDEELYKYVLWQSVLTEDLFIESLEAADMYGAVYDKFYGENGTKFPTDADIVDYLEESGYYRTKHILLKTVNTEENDVDADGNAIPNTFAPLSEEEVAAQLALAESILPQLEGLTGDALESKFDELMNAHSQDTDAEGNQNCVDGYLASPSQMVAEYEAASLDLDDWGVSGLVESVYGYHIIVRLPLEADQAYAQGAVEKSASAEQDSWLDPYPMVTNEVFDAIDMQSFYENLTALRQQTDPLLEAAFPTVEATPAE